MKFKILALGAVAAASFGCADSSKNIEAQYVSDLQYANVSCEALQGELQRISARLGTVSSDQDDSATADAVSMGVGLVLFWPALFLLAATDDQEAEIARLKGEVEAIHRASLKKECGIDSPLMASISEAQQAAALAESGQVPTKWRMILDGQSGSGLRACAKNSKNTTVFEMVAYAKQQGSMKLDGGGIAQYEVAPGGPDVFKVKLNLKNASGVEMVQLITVRRPAATQPYTGEFIGVSNEGYGVGGECRIAVTLIPIA